MVKNLIPTALWALLSISCGSSIQLGDSLASPTGATFEYLTLYKYELQGADSFAESIAALTAAMADPGASDPKEATQSLLNRLGSEGWELVAVIDEQVIFKRHAGE